MNHQILIQFMRPSLFTMADGSAFETTVRGELLLSLEGEFESRMVLSLERLGLVAPRLQVGTTSTGRLSLGGISGRGEIVESQSGRWRIFSQLETGLSYEVLDQGLGFREVRSDLFIPRRETFTGVLELQMETDPLSNGLPLIILEGELELHFRSRNASEELGLILGLKVALAGSRVCVFGPTFREDCPSGLGALKRYLTFQPIGFKDWEDDPYPTAEPLSLQKKFRVARRLWAPCCIEFDVRVPLYLVRPDLKSSGEIDEIHNSFASSETGVIEIFLVRNDLSGEAGGGAVLWAGTGHAKVVISDYDAANVTLLAHELGHVMNGLHPNDTAYHPQWAGDNRTVLQSSGSIYSSSPQFNSINNCLNANNDALLCRPIAEQCCLDVENLLRNRAE